MATAPHNAAVSPDTLITIKISVNDSLKKLKLPLRDLGATVLPDKLRHVLDIKPDQTVLLERYSDSAAGYITLDAQNPQAFKTLIRAAKAKLKLRLKATVSPSSAPVPVQEKEAVPPVSSVQSAPQMAEQSSLNSARTSTAFDRRSVGSGIFQFREALASQQTLVHEEDQKSETTPAHSLNRGAPESDPTTSAAPSRQPSLAFRPREPVGSTPVHSHAWSVYCNACDKPMVNEHFHCSICDGGDYDLCPDCVRGGKLCLGESHWLIKRFIQDGKVVTSTTERVSPRKATSLTQLVEGGKEEVFTVTPIDSKADVKEPPIPSRTCNSCVIVLPERDFVTCTTCEDFDLCINCHVADKHGHHPAHGFKRATEDTVLPLAAETKLAAGRNVRHNAICDGCDKKIYGVRHKCLNCPDWDYCNDCVKDARQTHPRHRFAALYQPIPDQCPSMTRHFGIYCDGPLCSKQADQSYIQGVRYKCTICHDTDFCASCEALPNNQHNRTHPLIKLKSPVRNVNISTENQDASGNVRILGDRRPSSVSVQSKSTATETAPVPQANVAQVQTVADFQPTEVKKEEKTEAMPIPIPIIAKSVEKVVVGNEAVPTSSPNVPTALLNAHFVRDSIVDGMVVEPESRFAQVWTLKNPGPHVWPAGCSVRYVGGDNMLDVDNSHPASVTAIADATESNVIGREVQVGEEVAFKVILKAPIREGKSISYWRLKAADGTPFGHRLWCDIEVKPVENPSVGLPSHLQQQQFPLQHVRTQYMQMARNAARQHVLKQQQQIEEQRLMIQEKQQQRVQQQQQRIQQRFQEHQSAHAQFHSQSSKAPEPHMPPPAPQPVVRMTAPSVPFAQPPVAPSEQPPAYDSMNLSARLAVMREQQKQRREQMLAQLNAQRDHLQAQGTKREHMPTMLNRGYLHAANMAGESAGEQERREAVEQRVAHLKANIIKTREEREKLAEQFSDQKGPAAITAPAEKISMLNAVKDLETPAEEEKLDDSQMVFPKLEKESPASSTYHSTTSSSSKGKAAYVENEEGEIEQSAKPTDAPAPVPTSPSEENFVDVDDDEIEVLSAVAGESEDDGFVTDEEWDILDASDNETVSSP